MTIVDPIKLGMGVLLLLGGVALLWHAKGSRGFNQKKQAGVLMLLGALLFAAIGFGWLDL